MLATEGAYSPHIRHCAGAPRQFPWRLGERRLPHYLLVTSLNGSEQIIVEGQSLDVSPGQTYLIQPSTWHVLGSKRGNQPVWIHFDLMCDVAAQNAGAQPPDRAADEACVMYLQPRAEQVFDVDLPVLIPDALTPTFRRDVPRIVAAWNESTELAVMHANLELAKLMFSLVALRWKDAGLRKPVTLEARLRQAEEIALGSLGLAFGVAEFAAAAGLSRAHFSEVFRRRNGISPAAFLRNERVLRAQQLLATTDESIAEVGAAVGYFDPSTFGRVFLAATGRTPRQYREQLAPPQARRTDELQPQSQKTAVPALVLRP